jgi:coenzyme F420 hydrogenase subunit beta
MKLPRISIESVTTNGLCTGCGLCAAMAPTGHIRMQMNRSGFIRPVALKPLSSATNDAISSVCPGLTLSHAKSAVAHHPLWGPLMSVQTGHAVDPAIRQQGSSGGAISALACYLLVTGKVGFIAQIAVDSADPLANKLQLSRTPNEVIQAAGSRYSPSAPLQSLGALLSMGEKFAFIGKPCDVAALRQYARINPAVDITVPYMISFMCAGIPSAHGTAELIQQLGADPKRLKSFRYRGDGWPGMARAVQTDGQRFEMDYNTSWGTILNKHLQFRCKICPDGTGEFADITCADAWYGQDGYPDFTERDGRSLILSRTKAGTELLTTAVQSGAIFVEPLASSQIEKMQPYQADRKRVVLGRVAATRFARGIAPRYRRLGLLKASLRANPLHWLRNCWGTLRRAVVEVQ